MKLNNKGFAVSTFMYMLLLLAIILILATLGILSSRRMILDRQKETALNNIGNSFICNNWINPYSLDPGTKYKCEVAPGKKYYFYILSENGDDTVNLIMDRNICEDGTAATEDNPCITEWYSGGNDNSKGPVTAMQKLYNATKNWSNVPNMNLSYSDEGHEESSLFGYGEIITTDLGIKITKKDKTTEVTRDGNLTPVIPYEGNKLLKARLPKESEVTGAGCTTGAYGSCPAWATNALAENSNYYTNNEHISAISGYWLLSSRKDLSLSALSINSNGVIDEVNTSNVSSKIGIRPVITIPKSMLK